MNQPSSLPREDHSTLMPLGRAQAALWTLYREAPRSPAYNMALALRLSGAPSRDALGTVVNGLVARHGMLRARFTEIAGPRAQVLLLDGPAPHGPPLAPPTRRAGPDDRLDRDHDHDRTQNGIEHSASVQQRRRLTARGGADSPIPEARS